MHTLALALAPVLAAEKSKVPFYVAGGLLVVWALVVSMGLGMRKPDFPRDLAGQRAVSAITIVLVLAAVSTAVLTSGSAAKSATVAPTSTGPELPPEPGAPSEAPPPSTPSSSSSSSSTSPSSPASTTSTASTAPSPAATTSTSLKLAANPSGLLAYDTKQLTAKAGQVTIAFANAAPVEHNVTIAQGSTVLGATPTFSGGSKTLALALKPGKYTFYCSVPGHRQAGMEGTLTVQ